jgi:hypothetical protein
MLKIIQEVATVFGSGEFSKLIISAELYCISEKKKTESAPRSP